MKHVFFLIYRIPSPAVAPTRWDRPDGGLVMRAKRICEGVAIADYVLADEIAHERYHCAPGQQLLLVEVFEEHDQNRVRRLHRKWERDRVDFLELMRVG